MPEAAIIIIAIVVRALPAKLVRSGVTYGTGGTVRRSGTGVGRAGVFPAGDRDNYLITDAARRTARYRG